MRKAKMVAAIVEVFLVAGLAACGTGIPSTQSSTSVENPETTTSAATVPVQPPAGWTKFTGDHAEIYLPPAFDLNLLDATTRESIVAQGGQMADLVTQMPQFPICVLSSSVGESGAPANVTVSKDEAPEGVTFTLKELVDGMLASQPSGVHVRSRTDNLRLGGFEATQLVVDHMTEPETTTVTYLVKVESAVWTIRLSAPTAELETWLPDFETSAATFRVTP